MKHKHEAYCAARQRNATLKGESISDLIAIGPDVVFVGEFLSPDNAEWSFHLQTFVEGDIHALIAFNERYEKIAAIDRYVLVNFLGDGRALRGAPSIVREKTGGLHDPLPGAAERRPHEGRRPTDGLCPVGQA
jgi:hypothetical protein